MDRLLEEYTDAEVAEQLNQHGYRTFVGLRFQSTHVYQLRSITALQVAMHDYARKGC